MHSTERYGLYDPFKEHVAFEKHMPTPGDSVCIQFPAHREDSEAPDPIRGGVVGYVTNEYGNTFLVVKSSGHITLWRYVLLNP
jgi:hypothetical protein